MNPFGITFKDVSGQVTPKGPEIFASIGICADNPNPSTILGVSCNNGPGFDTMIFVLKPFELQQLTYSFNVTTYANATGTHVLDLRFPSRPPARILGTTIASKTYDTTNGWQDIVFTAGSSDPNFQLIFFSAAQNLANAAVYGSSFFALITVSLGLLFFASITDQAKAAVKNRKPFLTTKKALVIGVFVVIGWAIVIAVAASTSGTLSGFGI